jgi:hypothetical protein
MMSLTFRIQSDSNIVIFDKKKSVFIEKQSNQFKE